MSINAFDHKTWAEHEFKDFGEYSCGVEYCNQKEIGDCYEGEWYYGDDESLVIYFGSFGNYNSPGADSYTHAEQYETKAEYLAALLVWESLPEYVEAEVEE